MQTFNLDIYRKGLVPPIYAKQGDVGREVKIILTQNGVAYPVPAGAAVSVWYSGASGEGNYTDIGADSAISVSGNEITVELIAQMFTNFGAGLMCLLINDADGNQLGLWNIPYLVEHVPGMDSDEAKAYYTAFSRAVQELPYPDATLSVPGKAADAAAVGQALESKASIMGATVDTYGAKGDGATDDTAAFQAALAANRVVRVPGGTYVLSGTLVIRENCCLELSQDTVLQFTQTSGNCIEVGCSATLKANRAVIYVPYAFDGHIIDVDTSDETERSTPPYPHWDPMWKSGRYIYDVCLVKANPSGLHYSTDGTCSGTAIYMEADSKGALSYIWGAMLQGIRIAGAFTYGIHVINYDDSAEDDGWNHDMRIEAVIQGCETSVSLTNCNAAHLALAIQCSSAQDGTKYAKWGVRLDDCKYTDMMSSFIWDWHAASTASEEYTHIAMYGSCPGLVLSDVRAISSASDIRDLIYTDTPSNLDSMVVLQEPITRWFKPVNGEPYFNNGTSEKPLMLREEMQEYFLVDRVQGYTDVLALSTDADGNIYNGIGYKNNGEFYDTSWGSQTASIYYFTTGFIPVKAGDILRGSGLSFVKEYDANCRISLFDANKAFIDGCSISATLLVNDGGNYFVTHSGTDDSFEILIKSTDGQWPVNSSVAYARLQFLARSVGDNPTMAINEEICYKNEGFLADGVKVKGDNVYLYSPGGKTFALRVGEDGSLSAEEFEL